MESKYLFDEEYLKSTGLPQSDWPLNNGVTVLCIDKPIEEQGELESLNYKHEEGAPIHNKPTNK